MKFCILLAAATILLLSTKLRAQSWTPMAHMPGFGVGTPILLTDGSVLAQEAYTDFWWRLVPDAKGSYVHGTWVQAASTPGWGPTYFASDVLKDGRVFVMGGEYNLRNFAESTLGYLYDPVADTWTFVAAPPGWTEVGDAASCVLPDGRVMMANILYDPSVAGQDEAAIFDPTDQLWTAAGDAGKADANAEEGWTLLPDGSVLTVDVHSPNNSERYLPTKDMWISAGQTISTLPNSTAQEIGPSVLMPSGDVFSVGATSNTGIFTPPTVLDALGQWSDGPVIAASLDAADGPACVLPDGDVLLVASPGIYQTGSQFFELSASGLTVEPNPASAPTSSSFYYSLLMLPNGQVMETNQVGDVEFYTPAGAPQSAWRPRIVSSPSSLNAMGADYLLVGKRMNGWTQCSAYGDDVQNATNYPIVCITNAATNNKAYCRTHDHSTMAVATGSASETTLFDVPYLIDSGPSYLQIIANGIASPRMPVTVTSYNLRSISPSSLPAGAGNTSISATGNGFDPSCAITLDGSPQPTTYVSPTSVEFEFPASVASAAANHAIGVTNSGGVSTNTIAFAVLDPRPTITSITPTRIPADGAAHRVSVYGTNFSPSSVIGFTWAEVTTAYVSSTELQFTIPAADTTTDGGAYIWVYNPPPGGGDSRKVGFIIGN